MPQPCRAMKARNLKPGTLNLKLHKSHGTGMFKRGDFARIGKHVVFERGVLVFHPENIFLGSNIYVGHHAILKGYYKNCLRIGDGTWVGQACFFHAGGGLTIGKNVGIGPGVQIITSFHKDEGRKKPLLHSEVVFREVLVEDDADIGAGAILLPGVHIGKGAQIGAGAVVTKDVPAYGVAAGVPAKILRMRKG